jgi:hypothetical protein
MPALFLPVFFPSAATLPAKQSLAFADRGALLKSFQKNLSQPCRQLPPKSAQWN